MSQGKQLFEHAMSGGAPDHVASQLEAMQALLALRAMSTGQECSGEVSIRLTLTLKPIDGGRFGRTLEVEVLNSGDSVTTPAASEVPSPSEPN